jgi:cellulose synthase operon protein YhjQ
VPLICFASPIGGSGRTTFAANVARLIARKVGARVVAVDLDPQNTLGLYFGLELGDGFGFLSTLHYTADGSAAWRAALRGTDCGVSYLPHGSVGLDGANAISRALADHPGILMSPLREILSIPDVTVVADLPSGPSATLAAVLPLTDLLVVPFLPDAISMSQIPAIESGRFTATAVLGAEANFPSQRIAFVLNQLDVRARLGRATADAALLHMGSRLLGVVHRDEHVPEAVAAQRLVVDVTPEARASREITAIAAAIATRLAAGPPAEPHGAAAQGVTTGAAARGANGRGHDTPPERGADARAGRPAPPRPTDTPMPTPPIMPPPILPLRGRTE